jgi:hypothetical protein
MFELTIDGNVYGFNFGMGFMREMNKRITTPVEGTNANKNIGLQYAVAGIMDGDVEELVNVLDAANKGFIPRVTRDQLDKYIDDENTDIDVLFETVMDFLKRANATKKTVAQLLKALEDQKQKNQN